jgi:hypothetical protein
VDVDGIRALISKLLASLPPGAGHVEESRERLRQYPGAPARDLDYLQLRVSPRLPDALDITIDVYDTEGVVNVWVGDFLPIELTAPIDFNTDPPRPFMKVIREALVEATTGLVDGEQAAPPWS